MFNFEKLDVWQKAIVFADSIYSSTRCFPARRTLWTDKSDAPSSRFHFLKYCGRIFANAGC